MVPPSRLMAIVGQAVKWCGSCLNHSLTHCQHPCLPAFLPAAVSATAAAALVAVTTAIATVIAATAAAAASLCQRQRPCLRLPQQQHHPPACLLPPPRRQQSQGLLPPGSAYDLFRGTAASARDEVEAYPTSLAAKARVESARMSPGVATFSTLLPQQYLSCLCARTG